MTGEAKLKGSVSVGRKVAMPNYGSMSLELSQEFDLDETTHEVLADVLADKVRAKLREWRVITD
jgi:hypothetical protein